MSEPVISASEGSVTGNQFDSSAVQFNVSDAAEQSKTVAFEARVQDVGGTGTANARIVVKRPAMATRLPDIIFPPRSSRVNNCGKRVLLEELKSFMERDPRGNVVLVGHVSDGETAPSGLDQQRALNAAAVISAGQGICGSFPTTQILVAAVGPADNGTGFQPNFCGASATPRTAERLGQAVKDSDEQARFRRVEVWFVPPGGKPPASASEYQNASTLAVSSLGCPK